GQLRKSLRHLPVAQLLGSIRFDALVYLARQVVEHGPNPVHGCRRVLRAGDIRLSGGPGLIAAADRLLETPNRVGSEFLQLGHAALTGRVRRNQAAQVIELGAPAARGTEERLEIGDLTGQQVTALP